MADKYTLTDEHRAQLDPWARKWIANAMSTTAMTDLDRMICRDAVKRLYRAADLEPPPDHRIIFVPSPFAMRFAAGFAAWIWYCREATDQATHLATSGATREATHLATDQATDLATRGATDLATWYTGLGDMAWLARRVGVGLGGLMCAQKAYGAMWQGGNQWSSFDSYLSFFRHIAKLPLDYSKFDAWETLSLHSGPRCVHTEFCIISDRPNRLLVDEQNRPHSEDGPFCRWGDGSALYAVHGVRVPAWIIERSETITVKKIDTEPNAEVRRVMIDLYRRGEDVSGAAAYVRDSNAKRLDHSEQYGTLRRREVPGDEPIVILEVVNRTAEPDGTFKHYRLRVPPTMTRSHQAWNWLNGFLADFKPTIIQS